MGKFYAVLVGKKTGVFNSWAECEAQVKGFKGAIYKSYPTKELAQAAIDGSIEESTDLSTDYIKDSLSVDAACSNNPGEMEYQCVKTGTGEQVFASKVFPVATNNIGEFLAVADALKYLHENDDHTTPIYSDSVSAIAWVRDRKVNSKLPRNNDTKELWDAIDHAIIWLNNHEYQNKVLKWNTEAWGESKADYGRK